MIRFLLESWLKHFVTYIVTIAVSFVLGWLASDAVKITIANVAYNSTWYTSEMHRGDVIVSFVVVTIVCVSQFSGFGPIRVAGIVLCVLGGVIWAASQFIFDEPEPYYYQRVAFIGYNVLVFGLASALLIKFVRSIWNVFAKKITSTKAQS